MSEDDLRDSRWQFLRLAVVFQGGVALLALGLAWLAGINPFDDLRFTSHAVAWGLAATVPMLAFFLVTYRFPVGRLGSIKRFLLETLGPPLSRCRWYDLVLLALLAGCSEELLFRGVMQSWFGQWGLVVGLLASNVLFGLAHAVTPTYAVLAGLLGMYLGVLFTITGEANLVAPILCHSLYDLVAFFVVRNGYRRQVAGTAVSHPSG